MVESVRVGTVGARFAAEFHLKGFQRVFGVNMEVVGAAAKSKQSAAAFARGAKIEAFAEF